MLCGIEDLSLLRLGLFTNRFVLSQAVLVEAPAADPAAVLLRARRTFLWKGRMYN